MSKSKTQVFKLPNLKNMKPSELKVIGGSKFDGFNDGIANAMANALGTASPAYDPKTRFDTKIANIFALGELNAADPIEGVLHAQILTAHSMVMELQRRAWLDSQSFEVRTKFLALADKAARTVAVLTEALGRHKGKGQQQIVVKHVTVNADQAIVADNVTTTPGGQAGKSGVQPHASQITDARQPAMPCDFEAIRETVPGPCRERS